MAKDTSKKLWTIDDANCSVECWEHAGGAHALVGWFICDAKDQPPRAGTLADDEPAFNLRKYVGQVSGIGTVTDRTVEVDGRIRIAFKSAGPVARLSEHKRGKHVPVAAAVRKRGHFPANGQH